MEVSGYQSGRRKEKGQRAEDGRTPCIFCRILHSSFIHSSSFFFFLSLSLGRNKDNLVGLGTGGLQRACRGATWGLRGAYVGPTWGLRGAYRGPTEGTMNHRLHA